MNVRSLLLCFLTPHLVFQLSTAEYSCKGCTTCYTGLHKLYNVKSTFMVNCQHLVLDDIESTQLLNLSSQSLIEFPTEQIQQIIELKYLELSNNSIVDLCSVPLSSADLPNLAYVDLFGNVIESPCLELFSDVKVLKLETNTLSRSTFTGVPKLEELYLITSSLVVPEDLFQPLQQVKLIYLHVKTASNLPDSLFDSPAMATSLKKIILVGPELNIQNRRLFMNIVNLQYIHLILEGLETIPSDIFYEPDYNCGNCDKQNRYQLDEIIIEGVKHLPNHLFWYAQFLSSVQITGFETMDEDLFNNTNLSKLVLTHGDPVAITDSLMTRAQEIYHLDISNNHLTSVGNMIKVFTDLEHLDISHNDIERMPSDAFESIKKTLTFLNMKYNSLCQASDTLFSGLENLEELYLNLTCLETIDDLIFYDLANLKKLVLQVHSTKTISAGSLQNLNSLQIMRINNQELVGLNERQVQDMTGMATSTLENSPNELQIIPPVNHLKYYIVNTGGELCDCRRGNYQVKLLGHSHESLAYCVNEEHLPFESEILCDYSGPTTAATEQTTQTTITSEATTTSTTTTTTSTTSTTTASSTTMTSPTTTTTTPTSTIPKPITPDSMEFKSEAIVGITLSPGRKTRQPVDLATTTPAPTTTTTKWNNLGIKPLWHAKRRLFTTRYVPIPTKKVDTDRRTDPAGATASGGTTTPSGVNTNLNLSIIKWAAPLGVGAFLLVILIPFLCVYCKMKKRQRFKKQIMKTFGGVDNSYLALSPNMSPPPMVDPRPSYARRPSMAFSGRPSLAQSVLSARSLRPSIDQGEEMYNVPQMPRFSMMPLIPTVPETPADYMDQRMMVGRPRTEARMSMDYHGVSVPSSVDRRASRMSVEYGVSMPSSVDRRGSGEYGYRADRRDSVFSQISSHAISPRIPRPSISN